MGLVAEDLEQVLSNLGMRLGRSTASEVWALCPGHDDTRPTSFSVNRETGASFCFACSFRRSDLVSLVVDVKGIDSWSAAIWLKEHGASLTARIERVRDRTRVTNRGKVRTESGYSLEGEFAVFKDVPDSALEERLLRRDSVDHYEVRWDGGDYIIPMKDRATGRLQGWQRRRKPRPKNYPENLRKSEHLFGIYEFSGSRAILVESPLDAVRLHSEGYDGAVASFGAWVSATQMRMIESVATRLLIAMDDDEAGHQATESLVRYFARKIPTHVLSYEHLRGVGEKVKDIGDMETEEIDLAIRDAVFAVHLPTPRRYARR